MTDPISLLDPRNAQAFLKKLPVQAKRKGEGLFRSGRVKELVVADAASVTTLVEDGEDYEVTLTYDPFDGWMGDCSCDKLVDCEHIFAAMSALLAEHRTSVVRNLSSSSGKTAAAIAASRPQQFPPQAKGDLAGLLAVATGRNLTKQESQFIAKIHQVYKKCELSRRITVWEFHELGIPVTGYGWDALHIWPSFPENEHEFWLYVAHATREKKLSIPEFMQPISDLGPIAQRIAQWRRSQEIQTWKQVFEHTGADFSPSLRKPRQEVDLRLVVHSQELRLQSNQGGKAEFGYLKAGAVRKLGNDYTDGLMTLTNEGEIIWQFFSHLIEYGSKLRFSYLDGKALRSFGRLLRSRQLENHIVSHLGPPLLRHQEPLRWELHQAANSSDDYKLRLIQADGSPAPTFICIVPGNPSLYVTEEAVFFGPTQAPSAVNPSIENKIPAPALENSAGVDFLKHIGVELPGRIRSRLNTLPFEVVINCQLKALPYDESSEDCLISVLAEAPDGHQLAWNGFTWFQKKRGDGKPERNSIRVYDRTNLELVPALLEPLNLRSPNYGEAFSLRVTRKFPEVFSAWLKTVPPQIMVRLQGELASLAGPDVAGRVTLDATEAGIDWFDLRVVLNVSDTTLSAAEVKALLNAKGGYVRLEGKGWRRLQYDLSEEENERLARLGLSPRELSAEPQRLHALQLADEAAKKFLPEQQVAQIHRRISEIQTRVAPDLPKGITAQLRPYQLDGFHFLAYLSANRFGGILADDMGLGKTLQTLAWLLWLRTNEIPGIKTNGEGAGHIQPRTTRSSETRSVLPSLVICPKSVMDNWQAEAARFAAGLRVKIWPANELNSFCDNLATADLHVLNYSQLRLLGENLGSTQWQAIVLDEGQYIKNPNSQTAQIARTLKAEHRLILSGTPIENRLLDLWSLMCFAMPGILGSRAQFARLHDPKGDPFARRRLAARVRPFVLRRTKNQVAKDLPDRIEEDLFCEIEGDQQLLYRAELKRAQQLLLGIQTQKELASQQFHFLTSLLRLRQICCDPRLVQADSPSSGAKAEALLDVLEPIMEEGQKVLVFSQFVQVLDLLRPVLESRNWPIFRLTGETENRGELVRQFQEANGPAIFLISLKAGGFGLNLTAASYVVLFDPWWNPAVENQAIDRTHRIGQTNKVIAYRLLIKNSIEEKIRELQKQKKSLAEDVLGEEKFSQSLTLDDLRYLFAD